MKDSLRIRVANGKYTVVQDASGRVQALRHGDEWRDCCGDSLILALAQRIEELEELCAWVRVEDKLPDDASALGPDECLEVFAQWDDGEVECSRYHYLGMDEPAFQRKCGTNEGCEGWGGNVGHVTHWRPMPGAVRA
jgi:hypothetical protein